jgi:uncharacterized membrane protein
MTQKGGDGMKSKHETGNRPFGNIHVDYINYKEEDKEIRQMYERIKSEYMKNDELDITLEKIYLEERFTYYRSHTRKYYFNTMIMVLAAFISGMFSQYFKNPFISLIALIILILMIRKTFLYFDEKKVNKEEYEHKYYNISLQVLNEIQEERSSIKIG